MPGPETTGGGSDPRQNRRAPRSPPSPAVLPLREVPRAGAFDCGDLRARPRHLSIAESGKAIRDPMPVTQRQHQLRGQCGMNRRNHCQMQSKLREPPECVPTASRRLCGAVQRRDVLHLSFGADARDLDAVTQRQHQLTAWVCMNSRNHRQMQNKSKEPPWRRCMRTGKNAVRCSAATFFTCHSARMQTEPRMWMNTSAT